jgi:sugar/nucleoside kinase (ribokinase family)
VAVIGELNLDLIAGGLETGPIFGKEILARNFRITLGSASAIFASGISKLGHPVTFISKVGEDAFGDDCRRALHQNGIPVQHVKVSRGSTTGVTISLSTKADRALVTHLGAIAELKAADVPRNAFAGAAHLHMTSFFLQHALRPSFAAIFRKAHQKGLTTSFDPNSDPSQSWGSDVWDVIAQSDILFVNEEEALDLSRKSSVEKALAFLGSKAPCVAVKRGRMGAIGILHGEIAAAPGFPIKAVDTTGAGDSFAAGFVHAYLARRDLAECLEAGNICGALSALQLGGTAGQPTRAQFTKFLRERRAAGTKRATSRLS